MRVFPCPACKGQRLKEKVLAVRIDGKSIIDVTDLSIAASLEFFSGLRLTEKEEGIARQIIKEIRSGDCSSKRLALVTSRSRGTQERSPEARPSGSGSATQIGSNLMGVLYVLDEPSIGLHQRDNRKLIETLRTLRDIGNTLIVVEHDEDMIRSADHVIDIGPGAGLHGGSDYSRGHTAADREEQKVPYRAIPCREKADRSARHAPEGFKVYDGQRLQGKQPQKHQR